MSACSKLGLLTRKLIRDDRATTSLIFSLSVIPMLAMAGAGMDLSRAIRERSELYGATDTAALAVGRIMKTATSSQMSATALAHLTASHNSPNYVIIAGPTLNAEKTEVCLTSQTIMPTTIMKIVNVHTVELQAVSCAKVGGTTYEVALALDNTGSMGGSKLSDMKTAAKNLIDQLLPPGSTAFYSQVSLIPFNSNVKPFNPDSIALAGDNDVATRFNQISWMDVNGGSSIHWENFPHVNGGTFTPLNRFELHKNINTTWNGCFEERPGVYAMNDAPASTTNPDSLFVPYFAPDEGDNASNKKNHYISDYGNSVCEPNDVYKTKDVADFFGDGQAKLCKYKPGIQVTVTGQTCTTERVCTQTNNVLPGNMQGLVRHASFADGPLSRSTRRLPRIASGIRSLLHFAGHNDDDDNGGGQTCTDVTTCTGGTTTTTPLTITADTSSGKGPNQSCDIRPITQLSTNGTALKTEIDNMSANGNTNLISAMLWAWRTISPNSPFANYKTIEPYDKKNHKKVIVFMTDGDNTWSTASNVNQSVYGPFGYFWNKRLGKMNNGQDVSSSNLNAYMNEKTLAACTAAKNAGVKIFTVGFSAAGSSISAAGQALLQACASSTTNYYLATNATQLNLAFKEIGDSLTGLRVSR